MTEKTSPAGAAIKGPSSLVLYRCPHGSLAVAVEMDGLGTRITSGKCCGGWSPVVTWYLTKDEWNELSKLSAEMVERARP